MTGGILEFLVQAQVVKTPVLTINKGLRVASGNTVVIQPSQLTATDEDSSLNDISYLLTSTPTFGRLEIYKSLLDKWEPLSIRQKFTQKDINLGRIRYVLQ